jgi:predicted 3-demethylubiquinone-9 3-methyltransferase (glyoxalase superfamily)
MTTYLWFDNQALESATFYVDLFPQSRLGEISYYQADAQQPAGSVLTVEFEIFGRSFAALNGGLQFPHSEAVSFQVSCETQEDVDHLWNALTSNGGSESQCGWCKDRWGGQLADHSRCFRASPQGTRRLRQQLRIPSDDADVTNHHRRPAADRVGKTFREVESGDQAEVRPH